MPRPPFSAVRANYPAASAIDKQVLFQEIGFDPYLNNPNYSNTCAIRVSLALVKSGLHLIGGRSSHFIQRGPYAGKRIEVLRRNPACLGQPDLEYNTPSGHGAINLQDALTRIGNKSGIISFYTWNTYQGGHIDILSPTSGGYTCGKNCYWYTEKVIFWELP